MNKTEQPLYCLWVCFTSDKPHHPLEQRDKHSALCSFISLFSFPLQTLPCPHNRTTAAWSPASQLFQLLLFLPLQGGTGFAGSGVKLQAEMSRPVMQA